MLVRSGTIRSLLVNLPNALTKSYQSASRVCLVRNMPIRR